MAEVTVLYEIRALKAHCEQRVQRILRQDKRFTISDRTFLRWRTELDIVPPFDFEDAEIISQYGYFLNTGCTSKRAVIMARQKIQQIKRKHAKRNHK